MSLNQIIYFPESLGVFFAGAGAVTELATPQGNGLGAKLLTLSSKVSQAVGAGLLCGAAFAAAGHATIGPLPALAAAAPILTTALHKCAQRTNNQAFKFIAKIIDDHIGHLAQVASLVSSLALVVLSSSPIGMVSLGVNLLYWGAKGTKALIELYRQRDQALQAHRQAIENVNRLTQNLTQAEVARDEAIAARNDDAREHGIAIAPLENTIAALRTQLRNAEQAHPAAQQNLQIAQNACLQAEQARDALLLSEQNASETIHALTSNNDTLRSQLGAAQENCNQFELEITHLRHNLQEGQHALAISAQNLNNLQNKDQLSEREMRRLGTEISSLQNQLSGLKSSHDQAQSNLHQVRGQTELESTRSVEAIRRLEQQIISLQNQINLKETDYSKIQRDLLETRNELTETVKTHTQLELTHTALQAKLRNSEAMVIDLQSQIERKQALLIENVDRLTQNLTQAEVARDAAIAASNDDAREHRVAIASLENTIATLRTQLLNVEQAHIAAQQNLQIAQNACLQAEQAREASLLSEQNASETIRSLTSNNDTLRSQLQADAFEESIGHVEEAAVTRSSLIEEVKENEEADDFIIEDADPMTMSQEDQNYFAIQHLRTTSALNYSTVKAFLDYLAKKSPEKMNCVESFIQPSLQKTSLTEMLKKIRSISSGVVFIPVILESTFKGGIVDKITSFFWFTDNYRSYCCYRAEF